MIFRTFSAHAEYCCGYKIEEASDGQCV